MKHRSWIAFAGFTWFFVGVSLLYKGLHLITTAAFQTDSLCYQLKEVCGSAQQAATFFIVVGLIVGFFKGRFVLSKTVKRVVTRIASLPLPIRFKDAYSRSYWLLIGAMMALGMMFRFLPISIDLRGTIDIAIGSALINGAMLYFRSAKAIYGTDSPAQSP
ncbi:MAG: hypothetical protein COT85_03170 [Chlamydiae bacterium CG10_big_fil_rev_8_21_14_0_10_42_34]|nr:MAG: hypothetical protein COT85_03170 [Chlamydiae bacterium CG10_big_fil_rev_8_21_14_0_10_42_34]